MKEIINGKLYNTETATEIGSYWNGLGGNDFRNISETLYKTKKGSYFLFGHGGAMTEYAESNGNSTWGSSKLIPLTTQEAFEWAQRRISTEEVEAEFPSMIEEA